MSFEEFSASLKLTEPPAQLTQALHGLWHDGRAEWDQAHQCVQDDASVEGAWVHAYLHRKEGDPGNAAYWYKRAGRPVPDVTLEEEWAAMTRALLSGG